MLNDIISPLTIISFSYKDEYFLFDYILKNLNFKYCNDEVLDDILKFIENNPNQNILIRNPINMIYYENDKYDILYLKYKNIVENIREYGIKNNCNIIIFTNHFNEIPTKTPGVSIMMCSDKYIILKYDEFLFIKDRYLNPQVMDLKKYRKIYDRKRKLKKLCGE
jgi:hypothetical protein